MIFGVVTNFRFGCVVLAFRSPGAILRCLSSSAVYASLLAPCADMVQLAVDRKFNTLRDVNEKSPIEQFWRDGGEPTTLCNVVFIGTLEPIETKLKGQGTVLVADHLLSVSPMPCLHSNFSNKEPSGILSAHVRSRVSSTVSLQSLDGSSSLQTETDSSTNGDLTLKRSHQAPRGKFWDSDSGESCRCR